MFMPQLVRRILSKSNIKSTRRWLWTFEANWYNIKSCLKTY